MDPVIFEAKLTEILKEFPDLGPENNCQALTRDGHNPSQSKALDIESLIDSVRFTVKYLMFDLESTQRENSYLRKIIEQRD